MQELNDIILLREYVQRQSEEAFGVLVARHVNKVYSVALRQTHSAHQAEEITQSVFVTLARKAANLSPRVVLSGWLYKTARLTAITHVRSEIRRSCREQEALMQQECNDDSATHDTVWPQIAPLLDTAMDGLSETDRHAIVLRFFDGRTLREVGTALGGSEDAAKKRVTRAVEKLRLFFKTRGVVLPTVALTSAISANAAHAAPVGLAKLVTVAAVAQGTAATAASGVSILAVSKGLLKPVLASLPFLGTFFFVLRSEVESTKSPRERQFVIRMIWLRFLLAALVFVIGIGGLTPALLHRPGVFEFGFAGLIFCVALVVAARTMYFHRRRREIQQEDGTWQAEETEEKSNPKEFLGDLMGESSKAHFNAAMSVVFAFVGWLVMIPILMKRMAAGGHWLVASMFVVWGGFAMLRWLRCWRQLPKRVFDSRFRQLAKTMVFCAVLSLVLFDASWVKGRLPLGNESAIAFNVAVVGAYGVLIKVMARLHKNGEKEPGAPIVMA